jgi:hypothetical protein
MLDKDGNPIYLASCVPKDILPSQYSGVFPAICNDSNSVCVPTDMAKGEKLIGCVTNLVVMVPILNTNVDLGSAPGACVPECIIGSTTGLSLERQTCPTAELCVPCSVIDIIAPGGCNTG